MVNTTTKARKKKSKSGCYHCGSSVHRAKDCSSATCTFCGESGHAVGSCPQKPPPPVEYGHFQEPPTRGTCSCFTFIELFAGMGGFRVALNKLGGHCVFASEVDRFCAANYQDNFGGDRPAGDITRIGSEKIPDHDLLVGGFPCQPFSSSGKREGLDDPRGGLFREIVRILKAKQPKAFLLENVRGLMLHESGRTYELIRKELEEAGYHVNSSLVDAKTILPQERCRLFIVGVRIDVAKPETFQFFALPNLQRGVQDILQGITAEDLLQGLEQVRLTTHQIAKVQAQNYTQKHPEARFLSDTTKPAKTLQSSYTNYMVGSQFVPSPNRDGWRRFSRREAARLQGFPESFKLCDKRPYHMLGNAVAPPIIAAVAVPVLNAIGVKWRRAKANSTLDDEWQCCWAVVCEMLLEAVPSDSRKDKLRQKFETSRAPTCL